MTNTQRHYVLHGIIDCQHFRSGHDCSTSLLSHAHNHRGPVSLRMACQGVLFYEAKNTIWYLSKCPMHTLLNAW
jgi:hypothetical protein